MKKEDIEFLKDLQHELLTQTNDGNANPVYWGIAERVKDYVREGCGSDFDIYLDGESYSIDDFIEYVDKEMKNEDWFDDEDVMIEFQEMWNEEVNKKDPQDLSIFVKDMFDWDIEICEYNYEYVVSKETGCFLTKRAAQEYIDRYGYNHKEPHTFAMTAYRNFEFERLIKILKELNINDIKEDGE